jgi:UTP--glucose-1-phosphate uridylyltransferase
VIGRYSLTPAVFRYLDATKPGRGGEIQLTDALRKMAQDYPLYAYLFEGTRYDAGNKLGFLQATVEFALANPEFGPPFRRYLRELAPACRCGAS